MKQNKYDEVDFYEAYSNMERSKKGLEGAGEWHVLKGMMPVLEQKSVLDLGCGYGWHCLYAHSQGASDVTGVDISEKMLDRAASLANGTGITYICQPIEDVTFPELRFDIVISSLAFHYVLDFAEACSKIYRILKPGGNFLFSVEHPVFTARAEQSWVYGENGQPLYWPVDDYQSEVIRNTSFLTDNVVKYHRTLSTYMNTLIDAGFHITAVQEPSPAEEMLELPGMKDELRRPMFLIISVVKPGG
ncbi:class I SAM-dependent methyltransferase [Paenibacillus sp. strain BS8-2]